MILALLYVYVLPRRGAGEAEPKSPTSLEQPAPAGTLAGEHPLAKHLEVSAVRIAGQKGGSARIRFVVTNHSAADLPELKIEVQLRSGDREFFSIPVTVPSLGPYESRELGQTVRTDLKPYEMPDWQLVQPRFRIVDAPWPSAQTR